MGCLLLIHSYPFHSGSEKLWAGGTAGMPFGPLLRTASNDQAKARKLCDSAPLVDLFQGRMEATSGTRCVGGCLNQLNKGVFLLVCCPGCFF